MEQRGGEGEERGEGEGEGEGEVEGRGGRERGHQSSPLGGFGCKYQIGSTSLYKLRRSVNIGRVDRHRHTHYVSHRHAYTQHMIDTQ